MGRFQISRRVLFILAGAGIVVLAVGVLVGWILQIPALTAVFPVYPTMKFNTALAFLLAGLATMLLDISDKKTIKYVYLALSAGVYIIGLLTLVEHVFGVNLYIDGLFFYDQSLANEMTPYPGRMVGSSALSFCILGAAYMGLLSRSDKIRRWAQYGLHLVTVLSGIALMGYLFNLTSVYKIAHFTSMAIHTSIAFLVLSVILSFYNPGMGVPGLFSGNGMGNQMARRMFPIMAVTTLFLGYVRVTLFKFHLVSIEFGIAMATTTFLLVTLFLVWLVARQINQLEEAKKETDLANYKLNADIASEQRARKEIAEADRRNALFVQQAPSAIAMFDTHMLYLAASEQWIKDYKLEGREVIGRSYYEVFPEAGEDLKAIHGHCLQGGIDKCDEYYFERADGTGQWISWDVRPWYKSETEIGGLLMYTADISHYKNNEALLKEATASLADAQQIAHVGSWVWELPGKELRWSAELYNIYGLEPNAEPASVELFLRVLHPEDRDRVNSELNTAIRGLKPIKTEFRVVRKDGSVRYVDARGEVYQDKNGRAVRIIGTIADLTERKKLEREKDEINKRNLLFVQLAPSPIAMFDTGMHYLAASEQWIKDYKLEGKEIIGRSHYEVFPEIGEDWKAIHRRCLQGAIDKCDEFYFVRADGSGQWIAWDVRPWYNAENKIGGLLMYTADISHHKKNEKLLQEATESLADAQQIAHVGSWEWNLKTNALRWSDEQYRIFGFEPHSITPTIAITNEMVHPEDREKMALAGSSGKDGKPYKSEFRIIRHDGSIRDIEARGRIFPDNQGKPEKIIGTSADITDRKKLERDLTRSEKEFRSAFEDSAVGMALTNGLGRWIKVNREFCKITGYTDAELMGMSFADITHPDDVHKDLALVEQLLNRTIDKYQLEKRYLCKDGSIAWIDLTVSMVFDEAGNPLYTVAQMKDITERKKLERDLMRSEKEFRSAFEDSAIGMGIADAAGKWIKVNRELCKLTGYAEAEMLDMGFAKITHPDDLGKDMVHMRKLRDGEIDKYQTEKRYICKNGSIVWIDITVSLVLDENKKSVYTVAQMKDITEAKRIAANLLKVNSELNSIFNTDTHVSIISADVNGIITHFSKGAETLLGYKAEELVGKYTPALFHDPLMIEARGKELSAQLNREIKGMEVFMVNVRNTMDYESREWVYVRKDGTRFPVQLVISAIKDDAGNIKGFLGIGTDITERKAAEEARKNYAVIESRNKEMEEFAYIASHDLQEPLRTVSGFVELLKMDFGHQLPEDAKEYLSFISASTKRMSELIKGLLEFSRIGKEKTFEPVDCNEMLNAVIADLGGAIKESRAEIIIDELPLIYAFRNEIKQLFQNLISNAIKFHKPGVSPAIRVSVKSLPGYWQFEIRDNGIGIEPRHYQKIFLLFQRLHNRRAYTGTGIGLSYCKKIVELHHGKIWVESVPGEGSSFFFIISKLSA